MIKIDFKWMKWILNQVLFVCKKYLQGLQEPCRKYFSSFYHMDDITKWMFARNSHGKPVNHKVKLSGKKVSWQYCVTVNRKETQFLDFLIQNVTFVTLLFCSFSLPKPREWNVSSPVSTWYDTCIKISVF